MRSTVVEPGVTPPPPSASTPPPSHTVTESPSLSPQRSVSSRPSSASRHRDRRHHHNHARNQQSQQQRYHFNHLDSGMPVNIWGIDRRDVWRTCFCFHVRTVTIFIGVCHLMMHILFLSYLAAMFMYDVGSDGSIGRSIRQDQMLPTPVSVSNNENKYGESSWPLPSSSKSEPITLEQSDNPKAKLDPLGMIVDPRKANSQMVLLTVCNMLITLLMVYGAVRGKPSYLMPFFVLRVFDFCIFCLTMVGYFSYPPHVAESITHAPSWLPNREALLDMDPQLLSLLALVTVVMWIAVKAYIIGVVWNCYKYLMLRNSVIRTVIAYRHDDPTNLMGLQQNLLPDLPDYDTAVNDPRYAKKPPLASTAGSAASSNTNVNNNGSNTYAASTISVPPPPYSVAIAAEPLTFVYQVPGSDNAIRHEHSQEQLQQESAPAATDSSIHNGLESVSVDGPPASTPVTVMETPPIEAPVVQVIDVAPAPTTTSTSSPDSN